MKDYKDAMEKNDVLAEDILNKLIKKAQKGDINAREMVVNSNLRLVTSII